MGKLILKSIGFGFFGATVVAAVFVVLPGTLWLILHAFGPYLVMAAIVGACFFLVKKDKSCGGPGS
jgi:hypothetical protein